MQSIRTFTPRVSKRFLLIVAAFFWTFAGTMLLSRGVVLSHNIRHLHWISMLVSVLAGGLFYLFLFNKISSGHVSRIISLRSERPSVFSFFSLRSYILMTVMISSGIILRKSGILYPGTLSLVYITMGIPLLLSSMRFFYYWVFYNSFTENITDEQ